MNKILLTGGFGYIGSHTAVQLAEKNREFVNIIHQGELKFPDKKPKGRPIDVTYTYDTSGKLHCIIEDEATKEKYEVSIRPESAEDLRKNYEAIEHIVIE